ncbi:hypothetical protein WJX81_008072 [Elliptochloris bilobata]|uniref:Uncharacterized protein n=1 Tax=Elliptochloris bilobata TaxID=381761 RepID=A0AAW1QWV2_9CHLO
MGARTSRTVDAYDTKRAPEKELGCFGILSRVACQAIIATILVAIAVLSIIALVYRGDRWAVYWTNNPTGQANYDFHSGWNNFGSTYSPGGYQSLLNFNFGCWVIGWICFAFLLACLVFAVIQFIVAATNQSGRHTCAFGVPLGICTVCMMAAYILAFILETREYSYRTTPNRDRYTPWPGFAWICGTVAGALWVVAGSAAFCMPLKKPRALPTTSSTATTPSAAAGTPTAAAAAAPERRSWFRRDRRAGADLGPAAAGAGAGAAAGTYQHAGENKYGAYPDVEAGHTPGAATMPGYNGGGTAVSPGHGSAGTGYGALTGTAGAGYESPAGAGVLSAGGQGLREIQDLKTST